jgi:hypothetical protein
MRLGTSAVTHRERPVGSPSVPRALLVSLTLVSAWALAGCEPVQAQPDRLDVTEPLTYFIAEGPPESGVRPADRTLARWAIEAWAALAHPPLRLVEAPEETATIRVYWVGAAGGLYGASPFSSGDVRAFEMLYAR